MLKLDDHGGFKNSSFKPLIETDAYDDETLILASRKNESSVASVSLLTVLQSDLFHW
jgi:hypothetical protein